MAATVHSGLMPSDGNLKYRLDRLDALLKTEFDLISHRMTWLVISQSFLFAAFSGAAANSTAHQVLKRMLWIIPFMGILIDALVYLAVIAAHSVIRKLKRLRYPVELLASETFGCEIASVDLHRWEHKFGTLPPYVVPPSLALAWGLILLNVF
jgi:hypothetical protein